MDIHFWVIIQIVIDFILMVLLLGYLRGLGKRRPPWQEYEETVKRSEALLAEMKQISLMLEKNLHEKREISRHLLSQLDEGLAKAQSSYKKICEWQQQTEEGTTAKQKDGMDLDRRSIIRALHKNGKSKEAIAEQLGLPLAEIELFLKLHAKTEIPKTGQP